MKIEESQEFWFGEENPFVWLISILESWLRPDKYELIKRINEYALTMAKENGESTYVFVIGMFVYYSVLLMMCCLVINLLRPILYKTMGPIHNNKPKVYVLNSINFITFFVACFYALFSDSAYYRNITFFYSIFFFVQKYFFSLCEIDYKPSTKNERRKDDLTMSEKALDLFKNILDLSTILIPIVSLGINISQNIFSLMPLISSSEDYLQNNGINMKDWEAVLLLFTLLAILKIFSDIGKKITKAQKVLLENFNKKTDCETEGITPVGDIDVQKVSINDRKKYK